MDKIVYFPQQSKPVSEQDCAKEELKALLADVFEKASPDPAIAQRAAMADVLQGIAQMLRQ